MCIPAYMAGEPRTGLAQTTREDFETTSREDPWQLLPIASHKIHLHTMYYQLHM